MASDEQPNPPAPCPNCGEPVEPYLTACPKCGLVQNTGVWPPPIPETKVPYVKTVGRGIVFALITAGILVALNDGLFYLARNSPYTPGAGMVDFLVVPVAMGLVAAYNWRGLNVGGWPLLGYSALIAVIGMGVTAAFWGEGIVCLLMASPLIIILVLVGALIGKAIFDRNNQRLNASLIPIVLAWLFVDGLIPHVRQACVTDTLLVHAPPAVVWPHVPTFSAIAAPPDYWLWRIGLPYPSYVHSDAVRVGAARQCVFTGRRGQSVFRERITQVAPDRNFAFEVVDQPKNPEIYHHVDIERGEITLIDNHNGTTTLLGKTWYSFRLFPTPYFDWWARDVARHVHGRAMGEMKRLAEASVRQ